MTGRENPLATIDATEAAVLRAVRVARQIIAEHSGLPLLGVRLARADSTSCEVAIQTGSADDLALWCAAFGVKPKAEVLNSSWSVSEHTNAYAEVDGVTVNLAHVRFLTDAEIAAWRATQAEGGEPDADL